MSAEVLRQAAALMRAEWTVRDGDLFCACEDSDHWFDRSICPEPCGAMHDVCMDCSRIKGYCAVEVSGRAESERLNRSWVAVAEWLEYMAERGDRNIRPDLYLTGWAHAFAVASAYLGAARAAQEAQDAAFRRLRELHPEEIGGGS